MGTTQQQQQEQQHILSSSNNNSTCYNNNTVATATARATATSKTYLVALAAIFFRPAHRPQHPLLPLLRPVGQEELTLDGLTGRALLLSRWVGGYHCQAHQNYCQSQLMMAVPRLLWREKKIIKSTWLPQPDRALSFVLPKSD